MSEQTAANGRVTGRSSTYVAAIAIVPSLFALAIVVGNLAAGAPRQSDENAWAHLFQLGMAAQPPLIALFVANADWNRRERTILALTAQFCSAAAALGALWWSGY